MQLASADGRRSARIGCNRNSDEIPHPVEYRVGGKMRYFVCAAVITVATTAFAQDRLQSSDLLRLRSVSVVALSPDASRVAYVVENNDGPGRPYGQLWVMTLADGKSVRFGGEKEPSGNPEWSPDGQTIAYRGRVGDKSGLVVARPDGSGARFLAEMSGTNAPLPGTGKTVAWSPDGKRIAFVSSTPGPETADATGDPMVITRYLYKPDADEGLTHFNDNRRLHLFVVDVGTGRVDQLTDGVHYEHSIDWSARGDELLFLTNRDADDDIFFNYDVYVMKVSDKSVRRLTATESNEYRPRWSPDGRLIAFQATKRGLTDRETTMEDTHLWVMNADGTNRREIGTVDNRQGAPSWSADGTELLFTVQERGNVRLYRAALSCSAGLQACKPEPVITDHGTVGAFSTAKDVLAYTYTSASDQSQLYVRAGSNAPKRMTNLNASLLSNRKLGEVEPFTLISNDNKFEVEAFLTKPVDFDPNRKYPLIVNIHGGPHGQQGPAFNFKNQVYAARGWATLMVNYRGSTGYGQAFADAVFGDQNGNEAQDVMYGVSAAIRRYSWIDRDRLGIEGVSYGGQLSTWIPTQTNIFKAAIPTAAITNIVSYNYMTYYNQYEAMEWGAYPHQGNLMDTLLQRSALRHVANNHTPTLLMHGENDNDVPIAEAEQFYIALKDVGTEVVMVRYPREGHGLRESKHVVDQIDRSIAWYEKHFPKSGG
jgi:dipeptidyl aminopeptidase/acylaminoacyl peptidase